MPRNSGNGNVMVERSKVVAKVSSAFCRASLGRRLIDTMRCGSSSRHRRSASVITSQELLRQQQQKSSIDAEYLHITSPRQNEIESQNGDIQTDITPPRPQSGEQDQMSGDQKHLKTNWTCDRQVNKTNAEHREFNRLVDCLNNDSPLNDPYLQEYKAKHGMITQEITAAGDYETEEVERKIKVFNELQSVVKLLQFGNENLQENAAMDVRRFAKDDAHARVTLAMLGAIPPLVGMLDSPEATKQISALFALLNLAIGNDLNKAAIVKAGAVHKMVSLLEGSNESVREAVVADFLSLSALDVNKPVIGSSGAIPFLVNIMQHGSPQGRKDALRALYNLSICHTNVGLIVGTDAVEVLLNMVEDMDVTEKVLGMLSNLAATEEGRKAIGRANEAFPILIDVLNWADAPKCQEKAAYILMIMAHNNWSHRQAMVESGMVSSLLELTLLGTTLAQKRASRILECLREDKNRRATHISAPITGQHTDIEAISKDENGDHMSEERKVVKRLVQQSLQHNMQRIIKRANLPQDFAPSDHFKSLTATSSSKSLPF